MRRWVWLFGEWEYLGKFGVFGEMSRVRFERRDCVMKGFWYCRDGCGSRVSFFLYFSVVVYLIGILDFDLKGYFCFECLGFEGFKIEFYDFIFMRI